MGYCYIRSEPSLWTVGTYDSGEWEPESDHSSPEDAARRVSYLNGKPPLAMNIKHDIIKCAHDLLADGSHPEYERGIMELVRDVLELADDDIRTIFIGLGGSGASSHVAAD